MIRGCCVSAIFLLPDPCPTTPPLPNALTPPASLLHRSHARGSTRLTEPLKNCKLSTVDYELSPSTTNHALTPFLATLTDWPSAKSFPCHSYEKDPGVGVPAFTISELRPLCHATLRIFPEHAKRSLV
jgi:hypothetical protein